jgi:hypothetical protein
MNRACIMFLGALTVACVTAMPVLADISPMVYNNTTSTALVDLDMENGFTPGTGTVTPFGDGNTVVTAASQGIAAYYPGAYILKSYRTSLQTGVDLDFATAAGDVTTTKFALELATSDSYANIYGGTTAAAGNVMGLYCKPDGTVNYYDSGWNPISGITTTLGNWSEFTLTHTNGTATWGIKVNGVSKSFTMTSGAGGFSQYQGILGGIEFYNGNYPAAFYLDGPQVPEPSTIVLCASGMIGLLAYAWRRRK